MAEKQNLEDVIFFEVMPKEIETNIKKLNSLGKFQKCDAVIANAYIGENLVNGYGLHINLFFENGGYGYSLWGTYTTLERHDMCMRALGAARAENLKKQEVMAYFVNIAEEMYLVGLAEKK